MRLCIFAAAAALLSASLAAHADPVFTFTFNPAIYTVGSSGDVSFTATIDNTGSTAITGLYGFESTEGTMSPYITAAVFGTTGDASLYAEFAGIDLAPGDSFTFVYVTEYFADAPSGTYTGLFGPAIDLSDSSGTSGVIAATNNVTLDVVPTPEPSSLVLLGTGLLGVIGLARRRLA